MPSNRDLKVFGFIWAAIFAFLSYKFDTLSQIFAGFAGALLAISLINAQIFYQIKFYQNWIKFGNIIGKVNGFLISFILFYGLFSPAGIVMRWFKKDLLHKKLDPQASSYFVDRATQPGDMKNQF